MGKSDLVKLKQDEFTRRQDENDEQYVKNHFWTKVKRFASKLPFSENLLALYYAAVDPQTPKKSKVIAFSALAYFILPIDVIPDPLVIVGWTDDAAILALAIRSLSKHVTEEHREQARAWGRDEKKPDRWE